MQKESQCRNCSHPGIGLLAGGNTEDSMAVLARHSARFDVLQVQFDPVSGKHLAVAGLRTLQVRLRPPPITFGVAYVLDMRPAQVLVP